VIKTEKHKHLSVPVVEIVDDFGGRWAQGPGLRMGKAVR